jgi:hypothetical protein
MVPGQGTGVIAGMTVRQPPRRIIIGIGVRLILFKETFKKSFQDVSLRALSKIKPLFLLSLK